MHTFILPTKIIFGSGSLRKIAEVVQPFGKRVLLVTGKKAMRQTGILEKIEKFFSEAKLVLFDKVPPEPSIDNVDEGRAMAKEVKPDVVIGLGGGSVIDCAKAVAGLANKVGKTKDYLLEKRQILSPGLPFIAIPTTSGTGAEVTPNAVLIDRGKLIKQSLRSPYLFSKVAILDPGLTLSLSSELTAYSGMDALCQAIESYVSIGANLITDIFAIKAIELIISSIIGVYKDGKNLILRENMLYGSLLSGIALFNARMGVVHGIAHPLGVIYGLPHGLICGLVLPYSMEFNLKTVAKKYKDVANALGLDVKDLDNETASVKAIEKIKLMLKQLNFPKSLKELGVRKKDFPKIIKDSLPSGSLKANPRKVCAKDINEILTRSWEGG